MNAEFHYYSVYFLCLRAGMPERRCSDIAFASQYVDNAILAYDIDDGGFSCRSRVTQNYLFWDEETLRGIYLPFHFIPGDMEAARRERVDGAASRWTVTPDSPMAKELLVSALRTGDDFRIGIALHAYADTWAHQHFSGRIEEGNAVSPASPLPPAGHLQALRAPDDAAGRWTDSRLVPELARVDNAARFRAAARKIYRYLRTHLRLGFAEEELVLDELCAVWARNPGDMKARVASFTVDLDVPPYDKRSYLSRAGIGLDRPDERPEDILAGGYDKLDWLRGELARRSGSGSGLRRVETRGRFRDSELRRWDDAARDHSELATSLLKKEGLL
jgi:hypothetical protein